MQADNAGQNQIADNGPQLAQISAKEFGAKFKSKRECFNFLASDCEVYLPPYGEYPPDLLMNMLFVSHILSRSQRTPQSTS